MAQNEHREIKSFIVGLWSGIFAGLKWVSVFQWVRKFFPKITRTHLFVDIWVLINLIFSMVCLSLSSSSQIWWWEILLLSYAGIRVFEVVIYQVNVLLFDPYRAEKKGVKYELGGYRRIVICLIHNYLEILFWFALYYRNFSCSFETKSVALNTFSGSLYFSLVTMSTLGYDLTPVYVPATIRELSTFSVVYS
jgi:hypothetical protein